MVKDIRQRPKEKFSLFILKAKGQLKYYCPINENWLYENIKQFSFWKLIFLAKEDCLFFVNEVPYAREKTDLLTYSSAYDSDQTCVF